jgi:hypothetical protein
MSTDLSLDPEEIITLYTLRFKIEGMFGEWKHELGGFHYHFWTSALEKRKRGEAAVLPTDKDGIRLVAQAKKAIDGYVCLQCIAQAILTILALTHSGDIWGRFNGWLRIIRTEKPSVMVTKQVVTQEFQANLMKLGRFPLFQAVIDVMRPYDFLYKKVFLKCDSQGSIINIRNTIFFRKCTISSNIAIFVTTQEPAGDSENRRNAGALAPK